MTGNCDRSAAITRSMLGWGIIAGPFYLAFGLILALTRNGFALARDELSLLLLGDHGWLQWLNLALSAVMTVVAAAGLLRTPGWPRTAAAAVGVYGACLLLAAVFPPDATDDFPPGAGGGDVTAPGVLHLVFGALGFVSIGVAAVIANSWLARRGSPGPKWSRNAGLVIILAFVSGGALSNHSSGVALIWVTVVLTWAWLAAIAINAYRAVPDPAAPVRPKSAVSR
ncbi:MAG TPA: DUF998 domain-containing protein [Mycobacteriales bacterium]|nr:DUF998 domain-containing protein [Mycobacteriales bacterium]